MKIEQLLTYLELNTTLVIIKNDVPYTFLYNLINQEHLPFLQETIDSIAVRDKTLHIHVKPTAPKDIQGQIFFIHHV